MPEYFFSETELEEIKQAIARAETNTSGEIRVHLEQRCKEDVLDHAAFIFKELNMHKTEQRNGVLFYVSYEDHKLAIIGDKGINANVPKGFWDNIRDYLISAFKEGNHAGGLCEAISMAGDQLSQFFPFQKNDVNELSNEVSFGKSIRDNEV